MLREEFARRRRPVRTSIAQLIQKAADDMGVDLPIPAEHLAVVVLELSNGLAIESIADPGSVPSELFGSILGLLQTALAAQAEERMADPGKLNLGAQARVVK